MSNDKATDPQNASPNDLTKAKPVQPELAEEELDNVSGGSMSIAYEKIE